MQGNSLSAQCARLRDRSVLFRRVTDHKFQVATERAHSPSRQFRRSTPVTQLRYLTPKLLDLFIAEYGEILNACPLTAA